MLWSLALVALASGSLALSLGHRAGSSADPVRAHEATGDLARAGLLALPLAGRGPVSAALGADTPRYRVRSSRGALTAFNPAQRLHLGFSDTTAIVRSGTATIGLEAQAIGYGRLLRPLGKATLSARANLVSYSRGSIGEWYVNGPLGVEHGFTLASAPRPGGVGPLTLAIDLHGNTLPTLAPGGRSILFRRAGKDAFEYGGLRATDAAGRTLPSRLALDGRRVLLHVDAARARYPVTIDPLIQQGEKLTGGAEAGQGLAGWSVAVSADGNTALVGGPGDEGQRGAAWVFTRTGTTWSQQGSKLTAGGESAEGAFGISVALSGDGNTALIGASADEFTGEEQQQLGSVRVFTRSGLTWTEAQKLEAGIRGAEDEFGTSVAISADGATAAIGAPADEAGEGAVWVFKLSEGAWLRTVGLDTCEEREFPSEKCIKREQETGAGQFGASVALSSNGDTILIGGPVDNSNAGAVWVYEKVAKGFEYQPQGERKTPTGNVGISAFGSAVSLSADGNTALVGGPFDNSGDGAAWVFTRSGFTWTQQGPKLTKGGGLPQSSFGASVALSADGNTALIGAPEEEDPALFKEEVGSAWAFTRAGSSWSPAGGKLTGGGEQNGELTPFGGAFGNAVALSSDASTGLIGGFLDHEGRGAAWVFSTNTGGGTKEEAPTTIATTPKTIPPVETSKSATSITAAQIAALLAGGLVPSGKASKIAALLKHGGFAVKLSALEAGSATIDWYQLPPGAKLARHVKPKPVLVAAGHLRFAAAGTGPLKLKLTPAGKKLLKRAKRLKLTARGTFTPNGGTAVKATRRFLLKR
ncbi:MAG TPA: hypothetical protein VLJ80_06860 [Solirubrobacteraceae bacterium]|nr:hypothetical protein [Solirubrobacteraceae bacterium]